MAERSSAVPNVLAILPGWMPSTLMDVVKPMLALERQGAIRFRVTLEPYLLRRQLETADLVVFCRNMEPRHAATLEWVQERLIPFIYDIDDNLFDVPEELVDGQYYRAPGRIEQLHRYLQAARLVRVYSPVMLERILPLNPAVRLVTPPLDWGLASVARFADHPHKRPDHGPDERPVRIVYATSRRDDTLYQIFAPALHRLLQEHPGRVEMVFWGVAPPEFRDVPGVSFRKFILNYNQFLRQFSQHGFDIGLAPLPDDVFHQSKTNNKFREYGACGIAGIYSNVSVYTGSVVDGQNGLLVENEPGAWYAALKRLVDGAGLRCVLGEAARRQVTADYPVKAFAAEWQRQIEAVLAEAAAGRGQKQIQNRPALLPEQALEPARPAAAAKIRQQAGLLVTEPAVFLSNAGKHLQNLAWLLRLNGLKRL